MPSLRLVRDLCRMEYALRTGTWQGPETEPVGDLTNPELYDCLRGVDVPNQVVLREAQPIPGTWSDRFGRGSGPILVLPPEQSNQWRCQSLKGPCRRRTGPGQGRSSEVPEPIRVFGLEEGTTQSAAANRPVVLSGPLGRGPRR